MYYFPDYVINVEPSNYHYYVWVTLSAIFHMAIGYCLIELDLHLPIVSILMSASYIFSLGLAVLTKTHSYSLIVNERGDFTYQGSVIVKGQILENSYCTTWYLYLCCNRSFDQKNMRLLIWRDAVSDKSYRRLCRIIRLKRQMI